MQTIAWDMVWCQFDGKIVFNAVVPSSSFFAFSLFFSLRFASIPIYSTFSLVFSIFFRCVYSFFYVPIKSHGNMYNTPTTLMWFIVSFLEFAFDTRNHPISKLTNENLASKKFRVFQLFSFHLSNVGFDGEIWCWDSKTVGICTENAFKSKLVFTEYILFTFRLLFFLLSSKLKTTAYWPAFQQSNRKKKNTKIRLPQSYFSYIYLF